MKRIVILGCENSHANTFLNFIGTDEKYSDIEVLGVYSNDKSAAIKLHEKYSVPVLDTYSQYVNEVDGVIITARHGDDHYKFAKPYISSGVPMFIDKPITINEKEALEFMRECKKYNVRVTGGSSCIHDAFVQKLAKMRASNEGGDTIGGVVRAPVSMVNEYGGFFFYSQHLVEIMLEIFGRYPKSVKAYVNGKNITCIFRYDSFDVTGIFTDGVYVYYAMRSSTSSDIGEDFPVNGNSPCFKIEFDEFYKLLCGEEQRISYSDFISPVFVLNAIARSIESGDEEAIKYEKV